MMMVALMLMMATTTTLMAMMKLMMLPKQQFMYIFIAFTILCMWHQHSNGGAVVAAHYHNNNFDGNMQQLQQHQQEYQQQQPLQQQQRSDINDIKDKIIELQCIAKCEPSKSKNLHNIADFRKCHELCKIDLMVLPRRGHCPTMQQQQNSASFQNIVSLQKLSCLDNCSYDFDCPEVKKCCQSTCGPVCMDIIGVRDDKSLPPIPKILKYKLPRGHKVELTIESTANLIYYLHVEVRYHIGVRYSPRKLGLWQWQYVEKIAEISDAKTKRTDIAFNLRPGRWYQVRVAAINANGFRGYSEPSEAFSLPNHPKRPKQPADLKVISTQFDGEYCAVTISWCPSKSNLPIEKYKIIWSLYVKSKDESLISNESYIKDAHQYKIPNLLPQSSYYIQVQAMSISGSRRLKSETRSILYNTTTLNMFYGSSATLNCTNQKTHRQQKYNNNKAKTHTIATTITTATNGSGIGNANVSSTTTATAVMHDLKASVTTTTTITSVTTQAPIYEVRFRLNRKFGMIVQISGFHPHKEKVYELCPKDTNCEQREYTAIRAKRDSLEFSKLKYNTTYMLKALKTSSSGRDDLNGNSFTFTTPKCENFRKRFPKMQIKC